MNNFFYSHLLDDISEFHKLSEDQTHSLIIYLAKQHMGDKTKAAKHLLQHAQKPQVDDLLKVINDRPTPLGFPASIPSHNYSAFSIPAGGPVDGMERCGDVRSLHLRSDTGFPLSLQTVKVGASTRLDYYADEPDTHEPISETSPVRNMSLDVVRFTDIPKIGIEGRPVSRS